MCGYTNIIFLNKGNICNTRRKSVHTSTHSWEGNKEVRTTSDGTTTLTKGLALSPPPSARQWLPPRTGHLPTTHLRGEVDKKQLDESPGNTPAWKTAQVYD